MSLSSLFFFPNLLTCGLSYSNAGGEAEVLAVFGPHRLHSHEWLGRVERLWCCPTEGKALLSLVIRETRGNRLQENTIKNEFFPGFNASGTTSLPIDITSSKQTQ